MKNSAAQEPASPGECLFSELTKRGMTQSELAVRTGVSAKHISTVINDAKKISASFARKLDIALGDESGTWLARQADYDNRITEIEEKNNITEEEKAAYKKMSDVAGYFIERNFMRNNCGIAEKIIDI